MGAGLQMKYLPLLKHVAEQKRFPVSSRCVFLSPAWTRSTFFPLRRPVYAISSGDVMVQDQEGIFFIPSLPSAL